MRGAPGSCSKQLSKQMSKRIHLYIYVNLSRCIYLCMYISKYIYIYILYIYTRHIIYILYIYMCIHNMYIYIVIYICLFTCCFWCMISKRSKPLFYQTEIGALGSVTGQGVVAAELNVSGRGCRTLLLGVHFEGLWFGGLT